MKQVYLSLITSLVLFSSLFGGSVGIVFAENNEAATDTTVTFEELYSMPEQEFMEFCQTHKLTYMTPSEAECELQYGGPINVMMHIEDYVKENVVDVTYSSDITQIDTTNPYDYDLDKLISELNLPEKYYDITVDYDMQFMICYDESYYVKLATIPVNIRSDLDDSYSSVRLYQLIEAWSDRNGNVFDFLIQHEGKQPDVTTTTTGLTETTTTTSTETSAETTSSTIGATTTTFMETATTIATSTETITTTTTAIGTSGVETPPQTGDSGTYKLIIGMVALITVAGTAVVVKTRK